MIYIYIYIKNISLHFRPCEVYSTLTWVHRFHIADDQDHSLRHLTSHHYCRLLLLATLEPFQRPFQCCPRSYAPALRSLRKALIRGKGGVILLHAFYLLSATACNGNFCRFFSFPDDFVRYLRGGHE